MITVLGWSMLGLMQAAVVLILIQRLLGYTWPWQTYPTLTGLALLMAIVAGWWRPPDDHAMATWIDERLHLKDRLATALYVGNREGDPFAAQVREEAQQAAAQVQLQQALPLRWTRPWAWLPVMLALTIGLYFVLPDDLFGLGQTRTQQQQWAQQQEEATQQAKEELAKTVEVLNQLKDPENQGDTPGELEEALQGLADVTQKQLSTPQAKQEAAARLSKVQEKFADQLEQQEQTAQTMQSALSRLDAQQPGPADRFAQALQRSDFAAALKELETFSKDLDSLSSQERQAMTQQLQNLAQQLAQAAEAQAQQQAQARQQMQQTMQDAGLSQQQAQQIQQQMQQGATQQQIAQQLQQQGMPQQQAQQLAQQLSQQQRQSQSNSQCQGGTQQMSQALQQMAQSACQQAQQGQQGQQQGRPAESGQYQQQQWLQGQGQMSQQLSQLAQMQQQLQQMRQAQGQMQQAMQSLGQGQGGMGQSMAQNQQMPWMNDPWQQQPRHNGVGQGIGNEPGGNPIGAERQHTGYQTQTQSENTQGQGRVIASWLTPGENIAGPAQVEFNSAVREARSDAERAITEDRVPQRYHQTIKSYFNQLPQQPEDVRKSPPPAPR